jgi:hypothetical protein
MPDTKEMSKLRYTSSGALAGAEELQRSCGARSLDYSPCPSRPVYCIYWTREYVGRLKPLVREHCSEFTALGKITQYDGASHTTWDAATVDQVA